jgi:hypothetical protein
MMRTVVSIRLLLAFLSVYNVALVSMVRETIGGSAFLYGPIEAIFGVGMPAGSFSPEPRRTAVVLTSAMGG